jgi:predicted negative regulator of RcsB-dependent stress response
MSKKEESKVLESAEVLQEKVIGAEQWAEKNPKIVLGVLAVVVLIVAGYFGYRYWVDQRNAEAQGEMFQAVRYFEADSLDLAMNGDGNILGFDNIIKDYSMTKAANLANFYAGAICLKQGKYALALYYLEDFKANDILVQARAYSLQGDAHIELKDYEAAASAYHKAANYEPNKYFTPTYLMKEALAYELAGKNNDAITAYDRIITEYSETSEFQNAKKYRARLTVD